MQQKVIAQKVKRIQKEGRRNNHFLKPGGMEVFHDSLDTQGMLVSFSFNRNHDVAHACLEIEK